MSWSQVRILPEAKAKVAQLVEHVKSILFNIRACSSVVERSAHNGLVAGSFPARPTNFALLVKWYNTCFVIRIWQFDSVKGHQIS